MTSTIFNAKNTPLSFHTGTIPDVSGGIKDYFQPLVFELVAKSAVAFQVVETPTLINFRGVIQPLRNRDLMLKPFGERAWSWFMVHADPVLQLEVDNVITWNAVQMRVMAKRDYELNGYMYYEIVEDYTGSGP